MAKQISNINYVTLQGWMVNELGLTGVELTVYAILWGFSQDGSTASRTPYSYFTAWTNSDERTIKKALFSLLAQGFIEVEHEQGYANTYKVVPPIKIHPLQNCGETPYKIAGSTPCKNEGGYNINNINNINKRETRAREEQIIINNRFEEWWQAYGGTTGKGGCYSYWQTLSDEEQAQVISHTKRYMQVAVSPLQPYQYLVKFQNWRAEKPKEQRDSKQEDLVMCKVGTEYKLVPRDKAISQGYKIMIDNDGEK